MFLTQRDIASVMETVQIYVHLLGNFELYIGYHFFFFQYCVKCLFSNFFPDKILKIVFYVHKIQEILVKN